MIAPPFHLGRNRIFRGLFRLLRPEGGNLDYLIVKIEMGQPEALSHKAAVAE
jgi:hypothetical protein